MPVAKTKFTTGIEKLLKGTDNAEIAESIATQMNIGIEAQVYAQKGKEFDLNENVKKAKKNVELSLMNYGKQVNSREESVANYIKAKEELLDAESALEEHKRLNVWLAEAQDFMSK